MLETYTRYLTDTSGRYAIPGLAARIDKGGETLVNVGLGTAAPERQVTPDTVFGVGSITKSFTALAVMQLRDAGKLDVTDRVLSYLPELGTPGKPGFGRVTLHHLLSHSAGLPPLPFLHNALARSLEQEPVRGDWTLERPADLTPIDTVQALLEAVREGDFSFFAEPGEGFSYCNEGFAFLGEVVARVSGLSYIDYVRSHILEPLSMNRTCFEPKDLAGLEDVTSLFTYRDGAVVHAPHWWDAPAMTAAGFLKSCTRDMQRYAKVFCHPEDVDTVDIVSLDAVTRMTSPHVRMSPRRYYGYGLMVQPNYQGYKLVEHGGNIKGVAAHMATVPEAELSGTLLLNITEPPAGDMLLYGLNLALGLPPATPRERFEPVTLPEEDLAAFVGAYGSPEGMRLTIARTDDGLSTCVRDAQLRTEAVSDRQLLVYGKGQPLLLEFRALGSGGYDVVTFHYRVLTRAGAANT